MADTTVAYGISADASGFEKGMQQAADSAKAAAGQIDSHFKKVQDAFAGVQKHLMVLAGIVAGGAFFKEAMAASAQLTGETLKLSKSLGITGTEAMTLRTELSMIGSNGDDYVATFTKFARQLKSNEAGMQSLGVQTRDANGHLRDSNELFTEAVKSVGSYKAGLDQNTYAQTLFGKSIEDVMRYQRLDNDLKQQAIKRNQELGLVMSKEGVEATKAYRLAMNDVGDALLGVKNTIGAAVMPVFTELAHWFSEAAPTAIFVFKVGIDSIVTAVQLALLAIKTLGRTIGALIDPLFTIGRAFKQLISGDMNGATKEMQNLGAHWLDSFSVGFEKVKNDANTTFSSIKNLWGKGTEMPAPTGGKKTMGDFKKSNGSEVKEKSRTSEWEAQLAEQKLAFQERMNLEGSFAQFGKQSELKFWQDKLAITTQGSAENIAVRRKLADLQLGIGQEAYQHEIAQLQTQEAAFKHNMAAKLALLDKQAATVKQRYGQESKEYEEVQKKIVEVKRAAVEQLQQIELLRSQGVRDAGLAELQARTQISQLDLELGNQTKLQFLAAQREFENQKTAIVLDGLKERERIALASPDTNVVELEKIHQDIQQLERQHQQKLADIRGQAVLEQNRDALNLSHTMRSGFENSIAGMLQGTMTLQKGLQAVWTSMLQGFSQFISKKVTAWALGETAQTGATVVGNTTRTTSDWMAATQSVIASAWAGAKNIAMKAWEVAANVYAAIAGIPYVGPFLAPVMAVAAAGTVMGYASHMASASGGYDIPGSVNPITQLHAREMVLPAKHADVIRSLADNRTDDSGGGGGGGDLTVNITAMDGHDVRRVLMNNTDALVASMKKARRDFQS